LLDYLKDNSDEAKKLAEIIDEARKNNTLNELCLTEGALSYLYDNIDSEKI
jgi:hypothetical protein